MVLLGVVSNYGKTIVKVKDIYILLLITLDLTYM